MNNRTLWREQSVEAAPPATDQLPSTALGATAPDQMIPPVLRRMAVHDRYQLELKLGYPLAPGQETRYLIDTYLFLPSSLGINNTTYTRPEFYRDIQTYIRMKTPRLGLEQVLNDRKSPLCRCERLLEENSAVLTAADEEVLRDSFRILRAVLKSAFQRQLSVWQRKPAGERQPDLFASRMDALIAQAEELVRRYRQLEARLLAVGASVALLTGYRLADEAISVLVEDLLLEAHQLSDQWLGQPQRSQWQRQVRRRIQAEIDYRRGRGYPSVLDEQDSEDLLQRRSALKKFTSSVLWLSTTTRREGSTLEQILFASAAGVSMIFATLAAFYAQIVYGQISLPVFLTVVIAYMFKDRIKELGRAMSAHILSRQLYDYRTTIQTQDGQRKLGYVREKMVHVPPNAAHKRVPPEAWDARRSDPHYEPELLGKPESIIHYAKQVTLRKDAFRYLAEDGLEISVINDITRLDIRHFLRKMDNPYEERLMLRNGRVEQVRCQRTYPLNLISVFGAEDGAITCERTLVVLSRKGIVRIEQFHAG
jgi:hypothetical protein